jgi:alpha/beta superfamily hydrolase
MFTQTPVKAPEDVLRIPSGEATLHGVLHRAAGASRGAVLICTPDGEERSWTHRSLVHFARLLAERGQDVLRFEYEGQGESSGVYETTSVSDRLRDIATAAATLRLQTGAPTLTAVGVRLGATLALEAAAADASIARLVMWEPVLDVQAYVHHLFRVNVTTQMVIHKKVVRTTEQLVEDVAAGGFVSANGYKLGQAFVGELPRLRPAERLAAFLGESLIVALPSTRIPDSGADLRRKTFLPFWKEPKKDMTTPKDLLTETADWIDSAAGGRVR